MINDKPDLRRSEKLLAGTDPKVIRTVGLEKLAFTRSGNPQRPASALESGRFQTRLRFHSRRNTPQIYQLETVTI
jgi:hypothetical protein